MSSASVGKFDYVIVGAGSAGCVLANRLTEDPDVKVLVLEAGGAATGMFKDMPVAFPKYVVRRDLNWNFESEPEPCLNGRRIEIPRGKGLGGSSMINGMVYARGHRRDYDDWAKLGLAGWGYADVLPYFRKSENSWLGEGVYHGGSGELEIGVPKANMLYDEIRAASIAAGFPATDDYHGAQSEGFQRSEMTVRADGAAATARVFLKPALRRPNLTLETRALASRVRSRAGAPSGSTSRSAAQSGGRRRARGHSRRRGIRLGTAAAAVRHRTRGPVEQTRHRASRRPAGRRQKPRRASIHVRRLADAAGRLPQRVRSIVPRAGSCAGAVRHGLVRDQRCRRQSVHPHGPESGPARHAIHCMSGEVGARELGCPDRQEAAGYSRRGPLHDQAG